jgi:peptide/nickel transport system ATP-binding protein
LNWWKSNPDTMSRVGTMNDRAQPLLAVEKLKKYFPLRGGATIRAVDQVSFNLMPGETLSIVGESGCGKSTLGRTAICLHRPSGGEIFFEGQALLKLSRRELRRKRKQMQFIFQDPYASLDTRQQVGKIIEEPLIIHQIGDRRSRTEKVLQLLQTVGLDAGAASRYPHEFSGGQRQRIGIARAVAPEPKLIIADEPVSALDVSIQSQILNLLVELRRNLGLSYIFISHDLAVVKHISDRVAVMYLGKLVEMAQTEDLFNHPLHPYTAALLSAIPRLNPEKRRQRLLSRGDIPDPSSPPEGCRFHPRCHRAMTICSRMEPELIVRGISESEPPHSVWCHLYR